ncbi:substrate-binding domain-containing protein [Sphaerochaeta sp. PS]|uniref:substrate-binding domain-containing protein n=1 Tax=Sphaerochaeta sp. PS TaxID=3076336 RepID=UPI0028A5465E|nr:substrate-binding domain-containing protein [Sphaerochaeta sp. PS]MDT4761093.1 substrate-binding domain-containing protein [Sphaerochaeta sp. PS]
MHKVSPLQRMLVVLVVISLGFFVFGCMLMLQNPKDTEGAYAFVIGISQANQREPWRLVLSRELQIEAAKHEELKLIFTDAADDIEKQKADIKRLLAYDVDLLIVSPCNAVALTQTVRDAYRKVPVIVLDRVVDGYDYSLFIGPENHSIGKQAAKAVLTLAGNEPAKVLELSASSSSLVSQDRHAGFIEAMSVASNVTLMSAPVEDGTRDSAEDLLKEMGDSLADVDIIFAHTDYLALGASKAVAALGLDHIKIVSIDGFQIPDGGLELLDRGVIEATITCPTGGKEAIQYALDILHERRGVPKQVILRNYTVTRENLYQYKGLLARTPSESEKTIRVGHAQIADEGGWRSANKESIAQAAKDFGIELESIDASSLPEQIEVVRSFIERAFDVIVLSPIVESGWEGVLEECKKAGIPVFLSDRKVMVSDENLYYSFIGGDFTEEGRRAMRWVVSAIQPTLKPVRILEIQGTAGASPTKERRQGFLEVLSLMKSYDVVASAYGDYNFDGGFSAIKRYAESHPRWDIDVIYCHNDDMALGAVKALKELGIKPGVDVLIVSIDGISSALKALRKGELNCVVECSPLLGPQLMKAIHDYMSGKDLPRRIITDEIVFTSDTQEQYFRGRHY